MHRYEDFEPDPVDSATEPGLWERTPGTDQGDPDPISWTPRLTLRSRFAGALSLPGIIGVAVFLIVVVATAVIVLQGFADHSGHAPAQRLIDAPATAAAEPAAEIDSDEAASADQARVFVHVVGEVHEPGVVELSEGSRVLDAIAAAGGVTPEAGLDAVNLARAVVDGEQIMVPDLRAAEEIAAAGAGPIPDARLEGGADGIVDLNRATADELEQLPSIGPALADRIVEWRDTHGAFTSVDQLLEVSGIGMKTLDRFRDRVRV